MLMDIKETGHSQITIIPNSATLLIICLLLLVCHAEMNAIFNKNCADISNCVIYTILFPCNQCAKTIIQSGIKEVVYMCDKNRSKPEAIAAVKMFDASGVKLRYKCYDIILNILNHE